MAIINDKINAFLSTISDLSDQPNAVDGLTSTQLKSRFDQNPEALRIALNSLIDNLLNITDNDSGSDNIGLTTISGISGNTVQSFLESLKIYIDGLNSSQTSNLNSHINNASNPHSVTKIQVGLGNADDTSDINKPISTATQIALDLKVNKLTTINGYDLSANRTLVTSDIADTTNYRYCTDAQKTIIGNTSGTNTGNETTTTIGTLINGSSEKTTPIDSDMLGLMDSASSNILKKLSWSNIKATAKLYFDTIYVPLTRTVNTKALSNNITLDTSDISDTTNKRYVTDANLTLIGNTSGTNTGDETTTRIGSLVNSATEKTIPVYADMLGLMDSESSNILKKISLSSFINYISSSILLYEDGGSASTVSFSATYEGGSSSTTVFDHIFDGGTTLG